MSVSKKRLKSNIWKMYIISSLTAFVLFYAIDKVFMELRGLSVTQIVFIEIIYTVCVLLLEVPSGALADRWSRKNVLALHLVFFMLNTILWIFAYDITFFILGIIACAIHAALYSGTYTSLLYDTAKQIGKKNEFDKILGNYFFYGGIFSAVSAILGGMVAGYFGITISFWITLAISFIALLFTLSLEEPDIHRTTGEVKYWSHINNAIKFLWKRPALYHLIFLTVILTLSLRIIDEYAQLYFFSVGASLFALGYLSAIAGGIESICAKFAHRLNKYKRRNIYLISLIINFVGFILIGYFHSKIGIVFVYLPIIATWIVGPLFNMDLHKELPSSHRSTGESLVSLLRTLIYIPVALMFSYLADSISIFSGFTAVGIFTGIYLLIFILFSYKKIPQSNLVVK
ncbi:hypothetical protein COV03_00560 [Candidatus Uhrbacteria bacterium CG10_big_fil_rev_8_21_14_0_10_41_26]|nr:MAG: hypothetical protein COY24_04235 [Candidatus Uhrbacteria bacterium CG_4_10_14_0_2_um_filter_41_21]PJE75361.1 MAG: hypothetical protein COV03_00560 [Candidatus Uhrbacteria bacterium CG10_big_fil_rev_8_21_14_0_10_41_26]